MIHEPSSVTTSHADKIYLLFTWISDLIVQTPVAQLCKTQMIVRCNTPILEGKREQKEEGELVGGNNRSSVHTRALYRETGAASHNRSAQ